MQVAPDPDGPLLQRDWEECLLNHIIIKINTDILYHTLTHCLHYLVVQHVPHPQLTKAEEC